MMTLVCALLMLGCAIVISGWAENTKKPAKKAATGNGAAANDSAAKAIDSAKKQAGDAVGRAGEEAGKAMEKAGEAAKGAMEALGKEFSEAATKAKSTLEGVEGGPEVLQKITDLFASARQSLHDLKDSKAAEAASSKLAELDGKIDEVSQSMKPLPEKAKSALAELVNKGIEQIKALAEKAKELPDVAEEVKAKLNAFVEKLGTLKG
jgi:hypothetical protein